MSFTTVTLTTPGRNNLDSFEKQVQLMPEVIECYTIAGIWDYVLKIVTKDIQHYEQFLRNELSSIDYIREIHSHLAVTEIKNTTEMPLNTQVDID